MDVPEAYYWPTATSEFLICMISFGPVTFFFFADFYSFSFTYEWVCPEPGCFCSSLLNQKPVGHPLRHLDTAVRAVAVTKKDSSLDPSQPLRQGSVRVKQGNESRLHFFFVSCAVIGLLCHSCFPFCDSVFLSVNEVHAPLAKGSLRLSRIIICVCRIVSPPTHGHPVWPSKINNRAVTSGNKQSENRQALWWGLQMLLVCTWGQR